MPLEDGAFALIEYTLRVKDTGRVVDTTSEEEARKAGIYDPKDRYGPRLVIVGEGRLIPGLEKAIREMSEGEEREIEIPPEEAFGKRDPEKIKIIPKGQFIKSGVFPEPGKIVEINSQLAVIRSVTGGRVVVDFNHPLAGKTIVAKVKVVKVLRSPEEKLQHLILRRTPPSITPEDVKVSYDAEAKTARVELSEKVFGINDFQVVKRIVIMEAYKYMKNDLKAIEFVERMRFPEEEREAGEKEGTTAGRQGQEAGGEAGSEKPGKEAGGEQKEQKE
ncbi:hypothetical protein CF15_02350 [Pyrodictium occultum]|uniref:Peptidyl-prolyl cis-trans isomerase n=1 Tax=Pyrodictium occultum TaxID=2309 RepID=A0A0V8RUF2_PYROC|nr:peptidylprolyl isomerase [Pyrodictium occultum]KSW11680.1 hypothetical protein CF15_02350 [Pyrodictium occultum]